MNSDDRYEAENDQVAGDAPTGDVKTDDYKSRTGQYQVPVQSDDAPVEDPINARTADSDETLGKF
jgi:hypothetical protein